MIWTVVLLSLVSISLTIWHAVISRRIARLRSYLTAACSVLEREEWGPSGIPGLKMWLRVPTPEDDRQEAARRELTAAIRSEIGARP